MKKFDNSGEYVRLAVWAIAVIGGALTLLWLLAANGLLMKGVFAPIDAQINRNVFEQSKSFRDGAVQELRAMQFEYIKAAPEHRAALASVIRHKASEIPADAMPYDLNLFLKELP